MIRNLKRLLGAAILYFTIVWGFALLIWKIEDASYWVTLGTAHLIFVVAGIVLALIHIGIALLED